jgi:zinc transport system ATP-binding protein
MEQLIALREVEKRLGDTTVLDNVSLALEPGQIVSLIGPNGAGKTTLARVALGLLKPDGGRVQRRAGLRLGYVPQHLALDESLPLTVDRFLSLADAKADRAAALARTGVDHLQQRAVHTLSGGEMQRVLLARALLRRPHVLVLDEPARGVDIVGQDALYQLLADVRDELGCAILLISHDLHMVMAATDRVICLHHHVCCHGTPESVSRNPAFRELFARSPESLSQLALYTHEHDHAHDLHGDVSGTDAD